MPPRRRRRTTRPPSRSPSKSPSSSPSRLPTSSPSRSPSSSPPASHAPQNAAEPSEVALPLSEHSESDRASEDEIDLEAIAHESLRRYAIKTRERAAIRQRSVLLNAIHRQHFPELCRTSVNALLAGVIHVMRLLYLAIYYFGGLAILVCLLFLLLTSIFNVAYQKLDGFCQAHANARKVSAWTSWDLCAQVAVPESESAEIQANFDRTQASIGASFGIAADIKNISRLPFAQQMQIENLGIRLIDHIGLLNDDEGHHITPALATLHHYSQIAEDNLRRFNILTKAQISQYIAASNSLYTQCEIIVVKDANRWPLSNGVDFHAYKLWPPNG